MASEAEPIEFVESVEDEIVDLTSDSPEPVVVDLTLDDSAETEDEIIEPSRNVQSSPQNQADSFVAVRDDEEPSSSKDFTTQSSGNARDVSTTELRPPGMIICPICMDMYSEIIQKGRIVYSTLCGHIFCSRCLRDSVRNTKTCPTCRKRISYKRCHPIYI